MFQRGFRGTARTTAFARIGCAEHLKKSSQIGVGYAIPELNVSPPLAMPPFGSRAKAALRRRLDSGF
jgi:hypothetical protein